MTRVHLLAATIISTIFLPWIPMPAGLPLLRPEWFIVICGLTLFPVSKQATKCSVTTWAVFLLSAYTLSSFYGLFILQLQPDLSDITEYLKPILYFLLFIFITSGKFSPKEATILLQITTISLSVASLVAIIQYFDPDAIRPLLLLYRDDLNELENYRGSRAWGTMANPNVMGFVSVVSFGLCLFTMRHRLLPLFFSMTVLAISFVAVFSTGSRTAMICLPLILLTYYFIEMKKDFKSLLTSGIVMGVIIWGFNAYVIDSVVAVNSNLRVISFMALNEDVGWTERIELSKGLLERIYSSPIFGHGPAKGQFMWIANIDNEYTQILFRFGLVGLIGTLGFVWVLARQHNTTRKLLTPLQQSMRKFSIVLLSIAALFSYTAGTYGTFQVMFLLIIVWQLPRYFENHIRLSNYEGSILIVKRQSER